MAEPIVGDQPITKTEQSELARLREENLRFRDLLIAKDAELGSLRGQVAAMEAGTGRLLSLVGRIRGMVPGFLLGGLSRLLRGATNR